MFTLNEQLWSLYTAYAEDMCSADQNEKMRILRCSLKNCYQSLPLWLTYLTELERTADSGDLSTLEQVFEQAKQQIGEGHTDKQFELDKFWHGALQRSIATVSADKDKQESKISRLREFYEAKFIELTHLQDRTRLTQWI